MTDSVLSPVANALITALIPILMAAIGLASKWILSKIREMELRLEIEKNSVSTSKDNLILGANLKILDVISQLTEKSVLALQHLANDFKKAAEDGVLSVQEKKELHDKALHEVKLLLTAIIPENMKNSSTIFDDELISSVIDKEIEAMIARLKLENPKIVDQCPSDMNFDKLNTTPRE